MSARKNTIAVPKAPQIVGTIHSAGSLKQALALKSGEVDYLEMRVDHFLEDTDRLLSAAGRLRAPLIVTVRHPQEGGAAPLSFAQRRELYTRFLPVAAFIDVELRSVEKLAGTIAEAKSAGVPVIVSDHHFRSMPKGGELVRRHAKARKAGADVFKLAANTRSAGDLGTLLAFLTDAKRQPLSVMGMGAFGKISRLLFARAGSLLNYGYLHQAQVPGQWEARLLKKRVLEVSEEL